jgi:hypothetical protein
VAAKRFAQSATTPETIKGIDLFLLIYKMEFIIAITTAANLAVL